MQIPLYYLLFLLLLPMGALGVFAFYYCSRHPPPFSHVGYLPGPSDSSETSDVTDLEELECVVADRTLHALSESCKLVNLERDHALPNINTQAHVSVPPNATSSLGDCSTGNTFPWVEAISSKDFNLLTSVLGPEIDFSAISIIENIGNGSFGKVFRATYHGITSDFVCDLTLRRNYGFKDDSQYGIQALHSRN